MKTEFNRIRQLVLIISMLITTNVICQDTGELYSVIDYPFVPGEYVDLPDDVEETSGLILYKGDLWTFNDSGGRPEIYRFDRKTGKMVQTVVVENAQNIDWEDITQDDTHIYIGDFGNNKGNRKDLKIYKIGKQSILKQEKVYVKAEAIEFQYADQTNFEVNNRNHEFDCESLISFKDVLVVFTKNWVDGITRMYSISKDPGNYLVPPVSNFNADGLITGADFNEKTDDLVFIGYKNHLPFIYLFHQFDGNSFNSKKIIRINFFRLKESQTEGIAWLDNETLIITTEKTKKFKQGLISINLPEVLKHAKND